MLSLAGSNAFPSTPLFFVLIVLPFLQQLIYLFRAGDKVVFTHF